jgi:hypothetical protein
MRTRLRLGAASAVAIGALLLATVLASPALAWHSIVTVDAYCHEDGVRVDYTVKSWKEGQEATVKVFYLLNGERTDLPPGAFGPDEGQDAFSGSFDLDAGTTGKVVVVAVAHWKNGDKVEKSKNYGKDDLPDKCDKETTTTTSTTTTTTLPKATTTTGGEDTTTTTEGEEVGGETSTTAAPGQLPFTGASSGPMLLAGIGLVGGGLLVLWSSRIRDRHAAR